MPRPRCCRRIEGTPAARVFTPAGRPAGDLEVIAFSLEEYEAIRLADFLGLYQEEAAGRMGVSRQTFGRTLEGARAKIARALVEGLPLRIEDLQAEAQREFRCGACRHAWCEPPGGGSPEACPCCGGHALRHAACRHHERHHQTK
jgi:predicted DNA-binding protein (UPF0251 family)